MTYQLAFKRKFVNGSSDFQGIGVRVRDSSLTVDADQFVVGSKSFVAPTRFYSDVSAGGKYYGDGSELTNLPIVDDPSKLPLAGGTMTGALIMQDANITAINGGLLIQDTFNPRDADINITRTRFSNATLYDTAICEVGSDISGFAGLYVEAGSAVGNTHTAFLGFSGSATAPNLRLNNPQLGDAVTLDITQINVETGSSTFRVKGNTFIKWDTGFAIKIREHDGQKVNRDDGAIVTPQGISNYDLFNYDYYLDTNGTGGFTFIIINPGGVPDPTITCPDILMVTKDYGPQSSFNLPKWTTARFILTPTDPNIGYPNNFVWMVSW
jgi:hypothetical protein